MNPVCSVSLCERMNDADAYFTYWSMHEASNVFSVYRLTKRGHKYMNI